MKSVAFFTLGCKVNQYETEGMEELFRKHGYGVTSFDEKADVYVINTCTVTHHGDSKSRQVIRRAKRRNPDALVVVVGCYVQVAPDEVMAIPGVDLVVGTAEKTRIVELVERAAESTGPVNAVKDIEEIVEFEELELEYMHEGRTRAFVKIQEGCRQFCTYCIIPYARGPLRSRDPGRIYGQVEKLVRLGYQEVVLTGIHVTSYGKDLRKNTGLIDIVKELDKIEGLKRIRLSSLEPTYLTERIIAEIARLDKVCRHFHLSLQSGCDETLKRMGRRYTTKEYRKTVDILRECIPGVAITTDIMVGFPGETDEEFNITYEFLKEISLSNMHVFKYSPRKGTPAAGYKGQIQAGVKDERSSRLIELAGKCRKIFHDGFVGQELEVLFEQESGYREGFYEGLSDNYIKVMVPGGEELKNRIRKVRLNISKEDFMEGHLA
ncbi:MAG: tRNA t(6)A37-methylthiotransferase [Firmicutes bacterium]|nr:tRNA t(6)A37-methylthiotransferase [Bacillota bacterium]MDI6704789.1 tRNA (N(6)-L-threonylcarbamoyladenosine(37)-C(2))-methylthiotransferase MtaB [Bacillota bacterium]